MVEEGAQQALRSRLVALTRDLILIPSDATRPDQIEHGLDFISNHLDGVDGVSLRRHQCDGVPSLLAVPDGVDHPDVLLCGHLDVITHPSPEAYRSRLEDGCIIGAGAGDMKGALAVLMEVFRQRHVETPGISLGLLVTTDEERGGECGVRYLFDDVGLRPGLVMIPDGGALNEITTEEKGLMHVRLTSTGHATHAARPWLGVNPLERLLTCLERIRAHFAGLQTDADHWHPTCTVTIMGTPNRQNNRIPERAEAVLDLRFPPPHTVRTISTQVEGLLDADIRMERLIEAEPTHLDPDPLFLEVTEDVTMKPARRVRSDGGSDARFVCRYGIPVIASRPTVGELHSEEEWIEIESMATFFEICNRYLKRKLG